MFPFNAIGAEIGISDFHGNVEDLQWIVCAEAFSPSDFS